MCSYVCTSTYEKLFIMCRSMFICVCKYLHDIHIHIYGKKTIKKFIYISLIKREIKYVKIWFQFFKLLFLKVKPTPCVFKHIHTCMRLSRHTYFDYVLSFSIYMSVYICVFACEFTYHDIINKIIEPKLLIEQLKKIKKSY